MKKSFLEIENVTFAASNKNKVNNVSFNIENEGDVGHPVLAKLQFLEQLQG